MKITYHTEIDFAAEAGDLLTRSRSVRPDDPSAQMADFPGYWEWMVNRYHLPEETQKEWKSLWIDPLTKAAAAGLAAAGHIPADRAEFFFSPRFQGFVGGAHMLDQARAFAARRNKSYSQLTAEERLQAGLAMANAVVEVEEDNACKGCATVFGTLDAGMQDDQARWFALRLIENAERYLEELDELLAPVAAALKEQESSLRPLAEACMASLREGIEQRGAEYMKAVYHTSPDWDAPLQVYPALIRLGDYSYYRSGGEQIIQLGVFSSRILPLKHTGMTYELLQETLKVLGDKRRMEILTLLRERPRYGQELAEELALTPATISHHMSMLLQVGLIALKQDGSRTQYSLEGDTVERLLDALRRTLL